MKIKIEKNTKNFIFIVIALVILGAVAYYAFNIPKYTAAPTTTTTTIQEEGVGKAVNTAMADLAGRLNVLESSIAIESADPIEWPDASLGCPQPGTLYAQVITPGYKVVLSYQRTSYNYHSAASGNSFLCEQQEGTTSTMQTTTSQPEFQEYVVEADDLGLYPKEINLSKGENVRIIFKVRSEKVYYGGLDFRSSIWGDTGTVLPGNETSVEFTADASFTYTSYWPTSGVKKATGTIVVS